MRETNMKRQTIRLVACLAVATAVVPTRATLAMMQDGPVLLAGRDDQDRARENQERAKEDQERAREDRERAREDRERAQESRNDQAYDRARNSIERQEWARAVEQFSAVVAERGTRADAALYWRAYALEKLNRQADALTSVAELLKSFPTSRWSGDAKALELQIRQRAGQPVSPETQVDDDLKLLAIQGLQHSNPEQAVPLLEKLLQGSQSPRLKERALFVLAQSGSPRAQEVIARIAKGGANPDLQEKAIQYIGMNGTTANRQLLSDVYQSSSDVALKRQVLRAFMLSGDRARVLAAATTEKSPELRGEAVWQLGVMGAREELWQLYQKEQSVEVKSRLIEAMGISGDSAHLVEIAGRETDPELLRRSIRQIGVSGGQTDALLGIYSRQKDAAVKAAVLEALFISNNATTLVALARKETDPMMKRRIVEKLSLMSEPAARNYMLELLEK
jgi:HEAT repeat protein